MSHQEGARTSPFSCMTHRPSHRKWVGSNTGLVGCQGFQRQPWGSHLLPLAPSQCGQHAPSQLGPRFRLPGGHLKGYKALESAERKLELLGLQQEGACVCVCVGGRGGKEQLTGPGSLPSSLPGTGARSQNGKNSSECASQETPPSRHSSAAPGLL